MILVKSTVIFSKVGVPEVCRMSPLATCKFRLTCPRDPLIHVSGLSSH